MPRILVIDDEPSVRLLLSYAFRDLSHVDVHVAATGTEGLALFDLLQPDVVYVDLKLPDMSGEDIVANLRRRHSSVPLVMMTAEPEHLVPQRENVDVYLNKPFRLSALDASLQEAMIAAAARRSTGSAATA